MSKSWAKSVKVYQQLRKRRGQAFCDGCGKLIKDDYYWKWQVTYVGRGHAWLTEESFSHLNGSCAGHVLLKLMTSAPTREWEEQNTCSNIGEKGRAERKPGSNTG